MQFEFQTSRDVIADVQGDAETGAFALSLDLAGTDQRVVASVDGWPAWNDGQVLLGEGTRTYVVRLGRSSAAEPHITKLPTRSTPARSTSVDSRGPPQAPGSPTTTQKPRSHVGRGVASGVA